LEFFLDFFLEFLIEFFEVEILLKNKNYIYCFNTIEEAKEARIKAVNELFKEFTHSSQKI
jgi:hypothetical protein